MEDERRKHETMGGREIIGSGDHETPGLIGEEESMVRRAACRGTGEKASTRNLPEQWNGKAGRITFKGISAMGRNEEHLWRSGGG